MAKTRKAQRSDAGKINQRARVMHGTLARTSGGLTKKDLKYNKHGRIVSVRKSRLANKQQHLKKAGYSAKKGKFGYIRIKPTSGKRTRKSRKSRK
jgi:hypothetical protein